MTKALLPACWLVSVVFTCIASNIIKDSNLKNAIADARERMASGVFTETDMTVLSIAHGESEEYKVLFEGIRDSVQLKKANELIVKQKKELQTLRELADAVESLKMSYENNLNAHREALAAANQLINAYKAKDAIVAETMVEKPANYSSAVPQGNPTYLPPVTKVETAEPASPHWQMPMRNQALAIIKKNAENEWGTNFSMVESEIKGQVEAYEKLVQYQKQSWKPLMRTLLNDAAKEWNENYRMMVREIERQIDAKDRLDRAR